MSDLLWIHNKHWSVGVYPPAGGKVEHAVDLADNFNLLQVDPRGRNVSDAPQYDSPFGANWEAGWDECCPAVGGGEYPLAPYLGERVPDHGELWSMPARCERVGSTAIKTHWRGVRFDYELSRDIRLDGNRLIVDYAIHHRDADSFRCAWSQHALLSRETAIELSLNSGSPWRRSHDHLGNDLPRDFAWPLVASGEDLSKPERLPAGRGWKVFSQGPIDAPAMIHYPVRKRILKMEYVSDDALPAYWGLWINSGGYKGIRQIALEPTHARSDYIAASIADNSAAIIARGSPRHWRVIWTIEPA